MKMPESKDRFETLHSFAESDPSKFSEVSKELLEIYRTLQKEVNNSNGFLKRANVLIAKLQDKLSKLEKENQDLKNEMKSTNILHYDSIVNLQKENSELHVKTDFLETEKEAFRKENQEFKEIIDEHISEKVELIQENEQLKANLIELRQSFNPKTGIL